MKKILILAAAAVALCSCADKNAYSIKGQLAEDVEMVYLFDNDHNVVDSAAVKERAFSFKGVAATPKLLYLLNARNDQEATQMIPVVIEPGKIVIGIDSVDSTAVTASGTPANDAFVAYRAKSKVLTDEYRKAETSDERRTAIEDEYSQLTRSTVEENTTNFFGVMMMPELAYELSGQEILDLVAKFSPEMQQTEDLMKVKESAEQKLKTDVGQPYIDVIQNNAAGEPVALKSVVENPANKFTLLDFWASWCRPCMGEVPTLKKTYDEFHAKGFEIFGVSFDKDAAKWQAAVADNGMVWMHVSDVNGFDNQAAKDYAVQGIPSNFLIDAEGKIVAKNLRGEDLYNKIAELLAE